MTIRNKDKLKKAFLTLFFSWGGDTPPEAVWAANDFLAFLESELGINFQNRFEEIDVTDDDKFEEIGGNR